MGSIELTRLVWIMNISGSPCDKRDAIAKAAAMDEHVDVLVREWMSKLNMPIRAYNVANGLGIGYEETFLEALEPALENIAKKGIKLAANAGAVATKELCDVVVKMFEEKQLNLTVAWIEGDAVLDLVKDDLKKDPKKFVNISAGKTFD
jgi:Acyclic terpene utilisation family protein AtuA